MSEKEKKHEINLCFVGLGPQQLSVNKIGNNFSFYYLMNLIYNTKT